MRVLAISNSFGVDANRYLHQIAKADGVNLQIVTLYIGGCSLEQHHRNMLADARAYDLHFNGQPTGFSVSIKEALLSQPWDVVTLQQASYFSPKPDTYEPYAKNLYDYVKMCAPKAKILIHQTWAYEDGSEKLHNLGYETAAAMFADVEKAYQKCHEDLGTDGIIPSGKLFMKLLENGIPSVQRDTFHASLGLGRYALGLLWYRMLTGRSVMDNTFDDFFVPVTEEEIRIAKNCAEAFDPIFAEK